MFLDSFVNFWKICRIRPSWMATDNCGRQWLTAFRLKISVNIQSKFGFSRESERDHREEKERKNEKSQFFYFYTTSKLRSFCPLGFTFWLATRPGIRTSQPTYQPRFYAFPRVQTRSSRTRPVTWSTCWLARLVDPLLTFFFIYFLIPKK